MAAEAERFPRTSLPPQQSPVFWTQQKDRYLRQLLIRDIEQLTGRRLVVMFGSRFQKGGEMNAADIPYITEVLSDCGGQPLDILLETPGGETDATEAIISIIGQFTTDIRALVANAAKSNGTMLALAASAIVMGPASELGPIEPSIGPYPVSTLLEDIFREKEFGVYTAAMHALRQSQMLATRLLSGGMMKHRRPEEIEQTVKALSTRESYASHGAVINRDEAERLGLQVERVEIGDTLWDSVWLLYCMLDFDTRRGGIAKIFEANIRSLAVAAIP